MTDIDTTLDADINNLDPVTTADGQIHPTLPSLVLQRGATLGDLRTLLESQAAAKCDLVVSGNRLRYQDGVLVVRDGIEAVPASEPTITLDGVTAGSDAIPASDLHLAPTSIFEDQIATRLGIPAAYLRRMRNGSVNDADDIGVISLLDRNVNHWLASEPDRLYTVRGFYNEETGDGIARAIMSGRYATYDHLDQLMAVLAGIQQVAQTNPDVQPDTLKWKVDLTERNMRVRVIAPQVSILSPELLAGYRDPWAGRYGGSTGDVPPVLEAGLDIRNSETGSGRMMIVPFVHVLVCTNGLTRMAEAVKRTHIGGEQTEGRIQFSAETQRKRIELVTSETADAVGQYLSTSWLQHAVDEIQAEAGVKVPDAKDTIEHVAKTHKFTDAERDSIFELFLKGGQETAGGVAQAITAHAHVASPTRAMQLDDLALAAMTTAARFASRS